MVNVEKTESLKKDILNILNAIYLSDEPVHLSNLCKELVVENFYKVLTKQIYLREVSPEYYVWYSKVKPNINLVNSLIYEYNSKEAEPKVVLTASYPSSKITARRHIEKNYRFIDRIINFFKI